MQDLGANTIAVDLQSGTELWAAEYDNSMFGPIGPGIGYGKIFVYTRIDRISALDLDTGQELWVYSTGTQSAGGAFQPFAFDNHIYATTQAAVSGHGNVSFHSYQGGSSGIAFDSTI